MTITQLDAFTPAVDMLRAVHEGQVSAVELLELHLRRIERYNPELNAIVTPNYEEARLTAREMDEEIAGTEGGSQRVPGLRPTRGSRSRPLRGLPVTIKDCIYVKGLTTTGGLTERVGVIDEEDAPLVARVRAAGAVIMGKTNVPPYASDWQSNNAVFGRSNNPWDLKRTPGGSTGGGAAAVAAGLTPLEFGGDFAGSVRVPAAFCGIYGHKPSLTALYGTGHFPAGLLPNRATSLAVLGPLARSATDLEVALDVVAGPDVGEEMAWQLRFPPARHERLQEYRVAILPAVDWLPVEASILQAQEALAAGLRGLGAQVSEVQPEALGDLRDYYKLYMSFMGAIEATGLDREQRERRARATRQSGDEFLAAYARGIDGSAPDFVAWHGQREEYRASFRAFFRDWDILLAPATIVNAFEHDDNRFSSRRLQIDGASVPYGRLSAYPGLANLSGYPGTAFPAGVSESGLPVGLQAIGPYLEDRTPIRFAALVAQEFGGFIPPPGYDVQFS